MAYQHGGGGDFQAFPPRPPQPVPKPPHANRPVPVPAPIAPGTTELSRNQSAPPPPTFNSSPSTANLMSSYDGGPHSSSPVPAATFATDSSFQKQAPRRRTHPAVTVCLVVLSVLLVVAYALIIYLLAAGGGGGDFAGRGAVYEGVDSRPLTTEAAALVRAEPSQLTAERVAALPKDEQFRVLVHLVSRALDVQERATERIASALRYPGKDVEVAWAGVKDGAAADGVSTPTGDVAVYASDRLVFRYDELANVVQFASKEAYDACEVVDATLVGNQYAGTARSGVVVELPTVGTYYFASTVDDGCAGGHKWAVVAATAPDTEKVLAGALVGAGGGGGGGGADEFVRIELNELKGVVQALTRHLVVESVAREQRVRGQGQSGLSHVRAYSGGTEVYNEGTYANAAIANIHNHADHDGTVGMGELHAVLNGVEFWTRHNDYRLNMPHTTDKGYHKYERVPWPELPPEVVACNANIDCQITEMREYFRAWSLQDTSVRDYRPYFKATLVYMEGAWISDTDSIEEPFASDRHEINAKTWRQLQDRVRFLANSGRKDNAENLPFLPSSVRTIDDESLPVIANFEYRIMTVPIDHDVELARFRVVDDLHVQLRQSRPVTKDELAGTRRARFQLHPALRSAVQAQLDRGRTYNFASWPVTTNREYIDELMEAVPGKDNYGGNLTDNAFGVISDHYTTDGGVLNTAYYSRYYQLREKDAMGRSARRRSFSDAQMWAAMTTQAKVVPLTVYGNDGTKYVQRWTYAVPLEIVYLSPLGSWNPYQFEKKDDDVVTGGGARTGDPADPAKAYDGIGERKYFYMTPVEFFSGAAVSEEVDAADTSSGAVGVLDPTGTVRQVRASGMWIHLPEIDGVGKLRMRWPIMPIHEEAHTAYKEVKATQAIVFSGNEGGLADIRESNAGVALTLSGGSTNGLHTHTLSLGATDVNEIKSDPAAFVDVVSSLANGHTHPVQVSWAANKYVVFKCDGNADACNDGHNKLEVAIV